jgi:uncharacterized protein DUF6624
LSLAALRRSAHPDAMTQNQDLRAELLRRFERDQTARQASSAADFEAMTRVDAENLPWLKQVIAEIGWPGRSEVGVDGAHAAWLLAQHADADPQFQRRCLDLLTAAAEQGEATRVELAYLTDRVLLAEGKPQEFGTQATEEDGRCVPRLLRDPDTVDQRRAAIPLEPMAEYLARMTQHYGPPQPAVLTCPTCSGPVEFSRPGNGQEVSVDCPGCGLTIGIRAST